MPFAQKEMGFDRVPKLFLKNDSNEADNPMGKTGFYEPDKESITIYIGKRHPKDIMRSLSHELMHHTQKCNGDFDGDSNMGEQGYAQNDMHLRTMEIQAYQASIVFRDWEDSCKGTIYYEHLQKGDNKMSIKDWKNKELTTLLSEAWGFKFNTLQEFDEFNGTGEIQEEGAEEIEEIAGVTTGAQPGKDRGARVGGKCYDDEGAQVGCVDTAAAADDTAQLEENEGEDVVEEETSDVKADTITKEHIEALVKKTIKEVLQKRKG
mgnify:CR=1 FL=1